MAVSPFVVFFAPDSTRITGSFGVMLDNAVATFRAHNVRQVRIVGHADRAGPAQYNQDLSRRRAEAVRAELIRRGYSGAFIIEARGEENPLVETDDGVAHMENRRVEIIMACFPNPGTNFEYMRCPQ